MKATPSESVKQDLIDQLATSISQRMATRFARRSFLGKVGVYATAAVGGAASGLLLQEPALAASLVNCGCNGDTSVSCSCLTGVNVCPSGTCECGCWTACNSAFCALPNSVTFCDCCNTSFHSSTCVGSCSSKPSNCFAQEWTGSCSPGFTIRCRQYSCHANPPC